MRDTLRLMTLNVAHGARRPVPPALLRRRTLDRNLDAISASILAARADVVALQEVDLACAYSGGIDHFDRIARGTDLGFRLHAAHGERRRFGMRHGHALLSRHPLAGAADLRFERRFCHDKGFVVAATAAPELGGCAIDVVSVHLEPFNPFVRQAQIGELVRALEERRSVYSHPLVVMGDMNAGYGGGSGVGLIAGGLGLQAWEPEARHPTFPARRPALRLDWILASPELRIVGLETLPDAVSDHAPVVAEIQLA